MKTFYKELESKIKALEKEWGGVFDVGDFLRGIDFAQELIIAHMEEWCAIDAYDSDKGPCDDHELDDSRGAVCSANELLETIKLLVKK